MLSNSLKILVILFCSVWGPLLADSPPCELKYCIRPIVEKENPHLEITLEFRGNKDGITEIELPSEWAGETELYQEIGYLECSSPESRLEDTSKAEVKRIHHPPDAPIQIHYSLQEKTREEWYYRPAVQQTHFFVFGYGLFVIPKLGNPQAHIILEWQDFPTTWTLANSFGVEEKKQNLTLSLDIFKHAVYVGGDFRILRSGEEKNPIFIAIREKLSFTDEQLKLLINTVVESQRQFWNDFDFPHYLITFVPTRENKSLRGTGLTNAFSVFVGDFSENDPEDLKTLTWFLSHEHFHTWNGNKMASEEPDAKLSWFTEGFTEYYSATLSYRAGLLDFQDYVDYVNKFLYEYYVSPVHHEENERIRKDYWNQKDVQRLPYVRGFSLALLWDKKIKKATQNQKNLDDFMKALFRKTQEEKISLTDNTIELVASQFLPLETVQQDLEKYIINGETLIPDPIYFDDICILDWMANVGFDLHKTQAQGYVIGVTGESNAMKAGLRNGHIFLDYHGIDNNISLRVTGKNGQQLEVKYQQEITRPIPQYRIREEMKELP